MTSVDTELWLYWVQLTARHVGVARELRTVAVSQRVVGPEKIRATLEELPESLSAIACGAFAVDGFTGAVSRHMPPRPRRRRANRAGVVMETLKAGFVIGPTAQAMHKDLVWLYSLRDSAVHSATRSDATFKHPGGISIPETARDYGLENAERTLAIVADILGACLRSPRPQYAELEAWAEHRLPRLDMALSG